MLKVCVKYVNNWRFNYSITGVNMSTFKIRLLYINIITWLQSRFINKIKLNLSPILSTIKNIKYYLLHKSFTHNPQRLLLRPLNEI